MHKFRIREFRLAGPGGDGRHPFIDDNGVWHGRDTPLLEQDATRNWRPRSKHILERILSAGYGVEVNLDRRMSTLAGVARALNKSDRTLAAICLVHAEFPSLPDDLAASRMAKLDELLKYAPDQPRIPGGHPDGGEWTAGAPETLETEARPPHRQFAMDADCQAEWDHANQYCADLNHRGMLGAWAYWGIGSRVEQCIRGMVSERCGGNPVK